MLLRCCRLQRFVDAMQNPTPSPWEVLREQDGTGALPASALITVLSFMGAGDFCRLVKGGGSAASSDEAHQIPEVGVSQLFYAAARASRRHLDLSRVRTGLQGDQFLTLMGGRLDHVREVHIRGHFHPVMAHAMEGAFRVLSRCSKVQQVTFGEQSSDESAVSYFGLRCWEEVHRSKQEFNLRKLLSFCTVDQSPAALVDFSPNLEIVDMGIENIYLGFEVGVNYPRNLRVLKFYLPCNVHQGAKLPLVTCPVEYPHLEHMEFSCTVYLPTPAPMLFVALDACSAPRGS